MLTFSLLTERSLYSVIDLIDYLGNLLGSLSIPSTVGTTTKVIRQL